MIILTKYALALLMLGAASVELFVRHDNLAAAGDAVGAVFLYLLYTFWLAKAPKPVPVDPGEDQSV